MNFHGLARTRRGPTIVDARILTGAGRTPALPWSAVALDRTVRLGEWEFQIVEQPWGLFVGVPDAGGMVDSVPRVPEQLEWAEAAFATLPALERVWPTAWKLPPEALPELEELFRRNGGSW